MIDPRLGISAAALEHPSRIAIVDRGQPIDFATAARRARQASLALRASGLDPSDPHARVAIVGERDASTLAFVHALVELEVPIVAVHPRLTPVERDAAVAVARPQLVVDRGRIERVAGKSPILADARAERPLAILFTSGTTGTPKGVMLPARAFVASAEASATNLGWRDDDRWLLCMPTAHVGGLSIVLRALIARRTVVLSPTGSFDPRAIVEAIARDRVTIVSLVPTMLSRLLDPELAWSPPPRLRAVLLGGAAASPALLERAADRGVPVLTTYGLTEACSQVTTQTLGTVNRGELGAGEPIAGVEVRIGAGGAIEVRGPTLASGLFPPGAHPAPFTKDGWLVTGDVGSIDANGRLHVAGRRDDVIVTGGENVHPVEVERTIESLPFVVEACVFGAPHPVWGEIVAAAVVLREPTPAAEIDRALRARLAPHKLPRRIELVDALPLNATGKVDREAVARIAAARTA